MSAGELGSLDHSFGLDGPRTARVMFTAAADGDLAVGRPGPALEARRRRLVPYPWSWLHQVHGATVVTVTEPGGCAGAEADAAVTRVPGAVLAVHTADCAPLALVADEGVVGAVHVGWRGLVAGVIDRAVERMHELGAGQVRAVVGPCIHAGCYEFGADDLAQVVARCGETARGITSDGRPALDVPAAVRATLGAKGVELVADHPPCTACDPSFFSHRARGDTARQAMLVWMEER